MNIRALFAYEPNKSETATACAGGCGGYAFRYAELSAALRVR